MNFLTIFVGLYCVILFGNANVSGGACNFPGVSLTDAERQIMLDAHNNRRSALIQGNDADPAGTGMYKLVWSCELEENSQAFTNACNYGHCNEPACSRCAITACISDPSGDTNVGENLAAQAGNPLTATYNFNSAATRWWKEITAPGVADKTTMMFTDTDFSAGHYTQMAWNDVYAIGCGYTTFPTLNGPGWSNAGYVVCRYQKTGNYMDENVYTVGGPPVSTACTKYPNSGFDEATKLCTQSFYPGATLNP